MGRPSFVPGSGTGPRRTVSETVSDTQSRLKVNGLRAALPHPRFGDLSLVLRQRLSQTYRLDEGLPPSGPWFSIRDCHRLTVWTKAYRLRVPGSPSETVTDLPSGRRLTAFGSPIFVRPRFGDLSLALHQRLSQTYRLDEGVPPSGALPVTGSWTYQAVCNKLNCLRPPA